MRSLPGLVLVLALLCGGTAMANAPERSLRPELRPGTTAAVAQALAVPVRPRPDAPRAAPLGLLAQALGLKRSPRPERRPGNLDTTPRPASAARLPRKGSVCGDTGIRGVSLPPIPGRIRGCGIAEPVEVREIDGIRLTQGAKIDCTTARALKAWINRGMRPAVGAKGGGPVALRVIAHYSCRTRNNRPGGRISEHGKGRAVDIAGIMLADGSEISVLKHWGQGSRGRALKLMHQAACGPFGTVLGPNSDRFHRDHFHFDTARYRSGAYCR